MIASASTRVNRSLTLEYTDLSREPGRITTELLFQTRRSLFYRFFGLGPQSAPEDESSYVRTYVFGLASVHYNLPWNLAAGFTAEARRDWVDPSKGFSELPSIEERFPAIPGLDGGALLSVGPSLRFDTRERAEYSDFGLGVRAVSRVRRGVARFRSLRPPAARQPGAGARGELAAGGRAVAGQPTPPAASDLPFYYLSSLGGELAAARIQRGPLHRSRGLGGGPGAADPDPAHRPVRCGQPTGGWIRSWPPVRYSDADAHPFSKVRLAGGVGFRVFVPPNVLGRVDLAWGGEGLKAYVVLGYPF